MAEFDFDAAFEDDNNIVAKSPNVSEQTKTLGQEKAAEDISFDSAFGESAQAQPTEDPEQAQTQTDNEAIDENIDKRDLNVQRMKQIQKDTAFSFESAFVDPPLPDGVEESFLKKVLHGKAYSPADWTTIRKSLAQKLEGDSLFSALTTPTGQYYVELGKHMPISEDLLKAAGMDKVLDVDPIIKYGPMIAQNLDIIAKMTGVPTPQLPDRFLLGMFLDTVMTAGIPRVLSKMAVKTALKTDSVAQLEGNIAKWMKSDPTTLREYERTLAKMEIAAAKTGTSGWLPATEKETRKMLKGVAKGAAEMAKNDTSSVVFRGVKYLKINNQWKAFKLSEGLEKTAYTSEVVKELGTLKAVKPPKPELGADDIGMFTKASTAFAHAVSSPQHIVPELYDLVRQKGSWMTKFKTKFADRLRPLAHIQKDEVKAAKIADYLNGELPLDKANFTPDDLQAANAFRQSWDELADTLYDITKDPALAPGKRMKDYYTHVSEMIGAKLNKTREMDSFALGDVKIFNDEMKKASKGFLKKRKGNKNFSKNPFKAFETYLNWASEFIADQRIAPLWEDILKKSTALTADYGTWYWNNTHGISSTSRLVKKADRALRSNVFKATLGWNLGASLVNRTQPFILGALRAGTDNPLFAGMPNFKPMIKGHKLLQLAQKNTKEGRHIREVLRSSTVLDEMSEFLTDEKLLSGAKDSKVFNQSLGKTLKDPMMMFQRSEATNKGVMYLGMYDDILTKIQRVKEIGVGEAKNTAIYLKKLGIDVSQEATEQAHKTALKFTMDTQLDMAKSGQNQLASLPVLGSLMMYTSYPIKATEMLMRTTVPAVKKIGKAITRGDGTILLDNDVQGLMRFVMMGGVGTVMADQAGIDADSIFGLANFVPNLSPILKMGIRGVTSLQGIIENVTSISQGKDVDVFAPGYSKESYLGARGAKHAMRDLSYAAGIPGAAQMWKLVPFLKIVKDNMDQKAPDGLWNVYDDKGTLMYRTEPIHALTGLFLPSADKMEYYESVRIAMADENKRKQLNNDWLKAKRAGNLKKAGELATRLVEEYGTRPKETSSQRKAQRLTFEEREKRRNRRRNNARK